MSVLTDGNVDTGVFYIQHRAGINCVYSNGKLKKPQGAN